MKNLIILLLLIVGANLFAYTQLKDLSITNEVVTPAVFEQNLNVVETNLQAQIEGVASDGSNYTDGAIAPLATTNQLNSVSNNLQAQIDLRLTNEVDLLAEKLYQYGTVDITITPTNAFVFDGAGTITGYSGTYTDIVIPYEIGGVAVTAIGNGVFSSYANIVTITAGKNIVTIGDYFVFNCVSLTTISLPSVTTLGSNFALECGSLTTLNLPNVITIGEGFVNFCNSLTTITLPNVTTIGDYLAGYCGSLTSVSFSANAPTPGSSYPYDGTPNVTNYVLDSTATGWTDTFGGRPVVFPSHTVEALEIKGDATINGVEIATTQYVDSAIGDIDIPPANFFNVITNVAGTTINLSTNQIAYAIDVTNDTTIIFPATTGMAGSLFLRIGMDAVYDVTWSNAPLARNIEYAPTNYYNFVGTDDGIGWTVTPVSARAK